MMLRSIVTLLAVAAWQGLLGGGRRRRPHGYGRELTRYRNDLASKTANIDELLTRAAAAVDELRRRAIDPEEASAVLQSHEDELDATALELEEMLAPEELHGLHMEYEANLERALRGIVTAQRGISITRLPHRPLEDEEPFGYWKRAEQNIVHAQLRMREVVEVLLAWEPGKRAEVSVSTRLHRA
jgi:hypothetical protein